MPDRATVRLGGGQGFYGDTPRAVCVPLHSGRTTIVLQTNITRSDGKLAAIVTQTQIVLPAARSAPE